MKNIKKLLSIVMVLTLVLSLGASAFAAAASDTVKITIGEKNGEGHGTYKAYQLMTLTTTAGEHDGGPGYSYTVNPKYSSIMIAAANSIKAPVTNDEELLKWLEDNTSLVRQFADTVYESVKGQDGDYTATDGVFDVPQGYYLIVEEGATGGATSQVMLDTAGRENITITAKEDVPSVDKQVADQNDSEGGDQTWGDVADWDINDKVPFRLEATIPNGTTNGYETYKLVFHDVQSNGLTFDPDSVKVTVNGVTVEKLAGYTVNSTGPFADDCTFEITFNDIKTVTGFNETDGEPDVIRIDYESTLNEHAQIGNPGNPNEVKLEYSNNPYDEHTGKTPESKVTVFTFELNVDKVGPDGETPLNGAGFTLFKWIPAGDSGSWQQIGEEVTGVTTFDFKGLDEGKYKIEETTVPAGYNKADDIIFTVEATYSEDNTTITGLTIKKEDGTVISGEGNTFTVNVGAGLIDTKVVNKTGVELPSTGGIGTTIFYVVGGILVAAAVILLVTRRRVTGAEK